MQAEQLSSHEVFRLLRPEQVNAISDAVEEVSFKAGETVYHQGSEAAHLYAVLDGQVSLRLPRKGGVSIPIEELTAGTLFGSCVCFSLDKYSLTAQCSEDAKLLKIHAKTLRKLMDADLTMGYAVQTLISQVYFKRYLETMKKLQAIVQAIPLEVD
jgi:CRP-like cAMP-binding protein